MNRYTLHKAGINVSEGMQRLSLDKATYERLLVTFIDDNSFNLMCQAIEEKNATSAHLHAHSLKGISSNLSLAKLYLAICPMVTILMQGSFEQVDALMPQVDEAYQLVMNALQSESQKNSCMPIL